MAFRLKTQIRRMIICVLTPDIELHGTLNIGESTRFQYFHTWRRTWPIAVFAALFVIILMPLLGMMALSDSESEWRSVLTNAMPFMFFLLFWLVALGFLPYWNSRKQFSSQSYLREPITYTFTFDNVSGKGQSASWTLAWNVFKDVRETKTLFLMYHHRNIAVIVPKRFFASESEIASWRQFVLARMEPKKIEPPGIVGRWC